MKTPQTVDEVIAILTDVKTRMDKIKAKNPDLSFNTYNLNGLSIDLIYDLYEYMHKDSTRTYRADYEKIRHQTDALTLWGFTQFPTGCYFTSVKVVKDCDCIERKEFKPAETV